MLRYVSFTLVSAFIQKYYTLRLVYPPGPSLVLISHFMYNLKQESRNPGQLKFVLVGFQ
jgi:hypothetical protein